MRAPLLLVLVLLSWTRPAWAHPGLERRIAAIDARLLLHPGDVAAWLARAEAHREHRDFEAARADLSAAQAVSVESPLVWLALGRLELEAGRPGPAVAHLNAVLRLDPGRTRARILRARAHSAEGAHLAAAEDYAFVIETEAQASPDMFLRRAEALAEAGPQHLGLAIATLDLGLARRGAVPSLELAAAQLELRAERGEAALARLARLQARASRKAPWQLLRGAALETLGRHQEASAVYRTLVEDLGKGALTRGRSRSLLAEAEDRLVALNAEQER